MKLRGYSVYDRKALQYHPPFFASTDGAAVRSFSDLANDPETQVGRHPGDYTLYFVGEYDDQKGHMIPMDPIGHVIDANALIRIEQKLPFFAEAMKNNPQPEGAK
ncbi:nonstructural protein [Blackfly microvirus SF02]|uniref:Nonstructural protein n=1 Tax=Blackfly microvirus SF02 TaxID=2576452 RepID=A0A4P8PTU8_9VIRU|nr:nonstructural protein [Blackfly microvirus SF02]